MSLFPPKRDAGNDAPRLIRQHAREIAGWAATATTTINTIENTADAATTAITELEDALAEAMASIAGPDDWDSASNPLTELHAPLVAHPDFGEPLLASMPSLRVAMNSGLAAPATLFSGTKAVLDALPTLASGMVAFCTDGRKSGEGAGAGTGCPVYYSSGWKVYRNDAAVTV